MFAVLECLEHDEPPVSVSVFDDYDAAYEDFIELVIEDLAGCTIADDYEQLAKNAYPNNGQPQQYVAGEYYVSLHTSGVKVNLSKPVTHGQS
jgi:hypothetical protein